MTPDYFTLLKKTGYLGNPHQTFAGETAVAMMLSAKKSEKTLCRIDTVEKLYCDVRCATKDMRQITNRISEIANPDYIMVGTNGVEENDNIYFENCAKLFPNIPLLQYKNIFGEGYTVPALGVYAAAVCLQRGEIPDFLMCDKRYATQENRKSQIANRKSHILFYNHFEGKNHTFILLSN
jgi:hypothetical protein